MYKYIFKLVAKVFAHLHPKTRFIIYLFKLLLILTDFKAFFMCSFGALASTAADMFKLLTWSPDRF